MSDHDIVLSVVDDDGIEAWLERVVEEPFRLEQVSRSDLTRVPVSYTHLTLPTKA